VLKSKQMPVIRGGMIQAPEHPVSVLMWTRRPGEVPRDARAALSRKTLLPLIACCARLRNVHSFDLAERPPQGSGGRQAFLRSLVA
jgi:hypothetical protein